MDSRVGGGVKNHFWMRTRADVLGGGDRGREDPDVTPRGAAMLAGIGIGLFSDAGDAVTRFAPPTKIIEPDSSNARLYEEIYDDVYVPLQQSLASVNHRLAHLAEIGEST